jgi:hypothetical protein
MTSHKRHAKHKTARDWSDGPHRDLYYGDMKFATQWQREIFLTLQRIEPLSSSPQSTHYTDWAIPTGCVKQSSQSFKISKIIIAGTNINWSFLHKEAHFFHNLGNDLHAFDFCNVDTRTCLAAYENLFTYIGVSHKWWCNSPMQNRPYGTGWNINIFILLTTSRNKSQKTHVRQL